MPRNAMFMIAWGFDESASHSETGCDRCYDLFWRSELADIVRVSAELHELNWTELVSVQHTRAVPNLELS